MAAEIRGLESDEVREWLTTMVGVFGEDAKDEDLDLFAPRVEVERSHVAVEDGHMVGTAGIWTYETAVPGGSFVTQAGVTGVTVLPTHRRRMILTRLMERQLDHVAERGEPFATLWASESAIYGRFGYGLAIEGADIELERHRVTLRTDGPAEGRVRLVDVDEARGVVPGIYDAATEGIPGTFRRTEADWTIYFADPEHWRNGRSERRWAVYERDGRALGYAAYRQKATWRDGLPAHELSVGDAQAVDGEAYAALYRFVIGIDLVEKISVATRRVDEPLLDLLVDRRRATRRLSDKIWLRIVDVPAALEARRYGVEGSIVLRVADDFGPWADGTYRLEGGPDGARCTATDDDPDLVVPVADLGSAYLGSSRLAQGRWLGRIDGDPDAAVLADRMFGWHVEPWCTVHF